MVAKKSKTRWELFDGYGLSEIKWSVIGAGVGLIIMFLIIGIQGLLFPYKEVIIDELQFGVEYIETSNPAIGLVEREIHSLVKTGVVLFVSAIFTLPNLKITNALTLRESLQLSNYYKSTQQTFHYEKYKWFRR